ncbi:hypothetical protein DESC_320062 [Desulfosarcina cetonica]|nr:hypothetical protein DESC_320062 [Desulfosarcina cetonica]
MDLALGASGEDHFAAGLAGAGKPFDLQGLGVSIASGPGAVAAAHRARARLGHFDAFSAGHAGQQFTRQIGTTVESALAAGILKGHRGAKGFEAHRRLVDLTLQEVVNVGDGQRQGHAVCRIVMGQGAIALRTGSDQLAGAALGKGPGIAPRQAQEILAVAGPQQIVAAADLAFQHNRFDIEKIEQAQAVLQDAGGRNAEELIEKNVEIRGAATEKEHRAVRPGTDFCRQVLPAPGRQRLGGHGAHHALEEAPVGGRLGQLVLLVVGAHGANEFRKIDRRGAALVTDPAGQAGIHRLAHGKVVGLSGDDAIGDLAR